jgi:hypothetical protein
VKQLRPEEQLELLETIASVLRASLTSSDSQPHSLLELKGLGKEVWRGIDAQKYVNRERNAWFWCLMSI